MTFSAEDKLNAVRRELAMRRRVYPRMVAQGKMTDGFMAANLEIMEAIEEDYAVQAAKERLL